MPRISKAFNLEITPEQFLRNCSDIELMETTLLLQTKEYQDKMDEGSVDDVHDIVEKLAFQSNDKVRNALAGINHMCIHCDANDLDMNKKWFNKNVCLDCWENVNKGK